MLKNAKEALGLHIWGMEQDGEELPDPSNITQLILEEGQVPVLINIFMPPIRERINSKFVKKTLSLPAWLAAKADEDGVNCSRIFQNALMEYLGISGGIAGVPEQFFRYETGRKQELEERYAHDSVFVMLNGNTIRLSFLSFGSEQELKRVIKSLLRFEAPGELSYCRPYMVNDMKDGSRVFACRPPFSESWAFFVRKFDSTEEKKPEDLIVGEGAEEVIRALRYFVSGGLHVAITGAQGSGKTTLLKAMVRYISPKYNLRIEETVFELWMRKEFPYRNILTFRETESVDATEGLDAFRKTDGNCLMMGEVGSIQAAALMIELSQVSEQQLFTHHAMTTEKLLGYFKNALLRTGTYSDERMAREQVAEAFDIHVLCEKNLSGKRFIKEITEIVSEGGGHGRILFRYRDGKYVKEGNPTKEVLERMATRLDAKEKEDVWSFFDGGAEL